MENSAFCVIDIGTGGLKCLVFDTRGSLIFRDTAPIHFQMDGHAIGFDPAAVWSDVCRITRRTVRQCSTQKKEDCDSHVD